MILAATWSDAGYELASCIGLALVLMVMLYGDDIIQAWKDRPRKG